jgi:Zn-dependent metalloprotease
MRVSMQPDGRSVKLLSGLDVETQGGDWEARAQAFLGAWGAALGLGQGVFEPVKVSHMKGLHAVQLQQVHEGLPVYQRFVVVTLSDDGRARSLSSDAALVGVLARGDVGEGEARAAAQRVVYGDALPQGVDAPMSARLVVVADAASAVVAWHVQVAALPVLTPVDVLVDSRDGRVLLARDGVMR